MDWVIWGTVFLDCVTLFVGFVLLYVGKLWFLDRMVWLYQDMQRVPEYRTWLY